MVRHLATGKYRRTRLFVLMLAHSRKAVRLLTWQSSAQTWAELHERAFRRLGGTPRTVVLDNLKEGVLTPDVSEPTLNPLYRDVLAHYGVVGLPCRVGDPDRKGKVESGIGYTQKTPLHGQRFERLDQAQAYLDRWETHWADTRIHGTTKRQVAAMFAEERSVLQPEGCGNSIRLKPHARIREQGRPNGRAVSPPSVASRSSPHAMAGRSAGRGPGFDALDGRCSDR
jgi:hypothetical protein